MVEPLRVLLVEDSADDAELLLRQLHQGGFTPTFERVDTAEGLGAALARGPWDLIVADYVMPSFSGLAALELVRELGIDVPFILVSGTIPDEMAVAAMKAGSHDYVSKQNLSRLSAAVRRELGEAEVRRERRRALAALRVAVASAEESLVRAREARASAEAARERAAFLAEASRQLSASLDRETTLARAARLAVPAHADVGIVLLSDGEHRLRVSAIAGPSPAEEARLLALLGDGPLDPDAPCGPLESAWGSSLLVPLVARGRTTGALFCATLAGGRRYGSDDAALIEELARRAAMAIDNAVLYREAQQAIRVRDDFLSIASHELRTPLTALKLQVQLMERDRLEHPGLFPERMAKSLDAADRQADRLTRLIDSLLDVSRLSAGKLELELEDMDLSALARDVALRFAAEVRRAAASLTVRAETPVIGWWDESRLDQVLSNLLSNAIKFGAEKPIEVVVEGDGERARLAVRDHGIGIGEEHHGRIFGRFERAVSTRHYGGLGLGLHIARQIVEAHAGTIRVESKPGEGTLFVVDLPRTPPRYGAAKEQG